MKHGRYGWSYFFLRWGLGLVFIYIGADILRNPATWIGYVPVGLTIPLSRETLLQINGGFDIAVGLALLLNFMPKLIALLATAHLIGILVIQGIDAVLIRDVGLLGTALALLTWPNHYRKRRWFKFMKRRSREVEEG